MKKLMIAALALLCGTLYGQNHWEPYSDPYEDYMAMIVVLQLDGEEEFSADYEIGAFCGDECRGSIVASYFPPTDRYLYQLPVFGNPGDAITFKLFDRNQNEELDGYEAEGVTYVQEGYGSLGNPYLMNFVGATTPPSPHNSVVITLDPGWNWISYLLTEETPLEEALVNLTPNNGDMIKSQQASSTYNAATGQWEGNLTNLVPGRGLLYLNKSDQTNSFSYPE